jgi:hypothetical protein
MHLIITVSIACFFQFKKAVLRIHDILVWIRIRIWIRGSMPLTNGSGSFSPYYFLKVHLHHFSKMKSQKEVAMQYRNQGVSYYFCLVIEGSGSIPQTNRSGSGSRRPKNIRIRLLRIRNTDSHCENKAAAAKNSRSDSSCNDNSNCIDNVSKKASFVCKPVPAYECGRLRVESHKYFFDLVRLVEHELKREKMKARRYRYCRTL